MRTVDFILKEIGRRKMRLVSSLLAVILGIAILVAAQTIGDAMYEKTKEELIKFGANILIVPKEGDVERYFDSSIASKKTIPQIYVDLIHKTENSDMLRAVSAKLYHYFDIEGLRLLVAGITEDERKLKIWWRVDRMLLEDEFPMGDEVLLGHYAASRLKMPENVKIGNKTFRVLGVLDETGSNDDYTAFIPLEILQSMTGKTREVNIIDISSGCIACPDMNIYDHAREIDEALPEDVRVIPVKQIAESQIVTLTRVKSLIIAISIVVLGLSVFLVMNYMFSSTSEQRREIGILGALGMKPDLIYRFFLIKAGLVGLSGGIFGYLAGTSISIFIGPRIAATSVTPLLNLFPYSIAISLVICIISCFFPARRAARLDPVEALKVI